MGEIMLSIFIGGCLVVSGVTMLIAIDREQKKYDIK